MKSKFDATEDRAYNPLNNKIRSYVNNNRIIKKLKEYNNPTSKYAVKPNHQHSIEIIAPKDWAEYRNKKNKI